MIVGKQEIGPQNCRWLWSSWQLLREKKLSSIAASSVAICENCLISVVNHGDNAHTVKRRLQVALNVPTEQSSLTFGDLVLKNNLSAVRKYLSLLLTRNLIHRSSSTPCLSPTGRDMQQRDKSGIIEILGQSNHLNRMKDMVKDIVKAIKMGQIQFLFIVGLGVLTIS
ncbi:hypothetical protein AHAS_Ahas19G0056600 [Arachis hypogaea]